MNAPHIERFVIVEEGKTLNLSCAASGNPMPHIEWRRDDGRTININGVESEYNRVYNSFFHRGNACFNTGICAKLPLVNSSTYYTHILTLYIW